MQPSGLRITVAVILDIGITAQALESLAQGFSPGMYISEDEIVGFQGWVHRPKGPRARIDRLLRSVGAEREKPVARNELALVRQPLRVVVIHDLPLEQPLSVTPFLEREAMDYLEGALCSVLPDPPLLTWRCCERVRPQVVSYVERLLSGDFFPPPRRWESNGATVIAGIYQND